MYKFLYITRMPLLAVTDSKGQFVVKPKVHGQRVDIHTGGIDAAWSLAKKAIPSSVATKKKGGFNKKLDDYIRSWQWRWENISCHDLCKKTAMTFLQKR